MLIVRRDGTVEGEFFWKNFVITKFYYRKSIFRSFWHFRRHFPELGDNLYGSLDIPTQRALEKERDNLTTNGTNSMTASLRGSNSSLNSMPGISGGVLSMC